MRGVSEIAAKIALKNLASHLHKNDIITYLETEAFRKVTIVENQDENQIEEIESLLNLSLPSVLQENLIDVTSELIANGGVRQGQALKAYALNLDQATILLNGFCQDQTGKLYFMSTQFTPISSIGLDENNDIQELVNKVIINSVCVRNDEGYLIGSGGFISLDKDKTIISKFTRDMIMKHLSDIGEITTLMGLDTKTRKLSKELDSVKNLFEKEYQSNVSIEDLLRALEKFNQRLRLKGYGDFVYSYQAASSSARVVFPVQDGYTKNIYIDFMLNNDQDIEIATYLPIQISEEDSKRLVAKLNYIEQSQSEEILLTTNWVLGRWSSFSLVTGDKVVGFKGLIESGLQAYADLDEHIQGVLNETLTSWKRVSELREFDQLTKGILDV